MKQRLLVIHPTLHNLHHDLCSLPTNTPPPLTRHPPRPLFHRCSRCISGQSLSIPPLFVLWSCAPACLPCHSPLPIPHFPPPVPWISTGGVFHLWPASVSLCNFPSLPLHIASGRSFSLALIRLSGLPSNLQLKAYSEPHSSSQALIIATIGPRRLVDRRQGVGSLPEPAKHSFHCSQLHRRNATLQFSAITSLRP